MADDTPESFICPLTLEMMTDPVTAADGHSYECSAITAWLRNSALSPLTGEQLPHKQLTRSHALRNAIQEHVQLKKKQHKQKIERAASGDGAAATALPASGAKVILLGDSNVGKSSLVQRVKEGTFSEGGAAPTIGCSFCTHTIADPFGTGAVDLALWDTAGQEKYRSFTRQYFRGAQAAIVMYDITTASSFEGLQRWLDDVNAEVPAGSVHSGGCLLFVVGAKLDCEPKRVVNADAAKALAALAKAEHLEVSSKTGENVDALFARIAQLVRERQRLAEQQQQQQMQQQQGRSGQLNIRPPQQQQVQVQVRRSSGSSGGGCACQ